MIKVHVSKADLYEFQGHVEAETLPLEIQVKLMATDDTDISELEVIGTFYDSGAPKFTSLRIYGTNDEMVYLDRYSKEIDAQNLNQQIYVKLWGKYV